MAWLGGRGRWSVIGDRLSVIGMLECVMRSDSSAQVLRNSRSEFRLLAPLAMDVFIFPSVFSMMARMVILYSENVLDGTKSVC